MKVLFEPHHEAYFFGPERHADTYLRKEPHRYNPLATYANAERTLTARYEDFDALFIKEIIYFAQGRFHKLVEEPMDAFKHTFLIRDPRKSILSLHKALKAIDRLSRMSTEMAGFRSLHELFLTVQQVDIEPVVVDADDLLENPKEMMKLYCSATGLPFSEDMLSWTPGYVADWTKWPDYEVWHGETANSSGFQQKSKSTAASAFNISLVEYSREVQEIVSSAMPYYEAMYNSRLRISSNPH